MLERYRITHWGLAADPVGEVVKYVDAQATIADLQGQVKEAQERLSLCEHELGSVRIDRAILQQRVAQLEGENDSIKRDTASMIDVATNRLKEELRDLQADHARVLGLVRTACERWRAQTNAQEGISFRMAMKELEASLPAQPAQGGAASKPVTTCNRHSDCDAADEKARAKGALHAEMKELAR